MPEHLIYDTRGAILQRLLTAVVAIPLLLALIWVPELRWAYTGVVVVIALLAYREYMRLAASTGGEVDGGLSALGAVAVTVCGGAPGLIVAVLTVALSSLRRFEEKVPACLAMTVFGLVYVGFFAHFAVALAFIPNYSLYLTLFYAIVMCSDTGAYLVGSAVGRHKLAPRLSPNKSWEGAVGGVLMAYAGAAAVIATLGEWAWLETQGALIFFLPGAVSIASQLGDLMASAFKRRAGVKDSGALFPGHGGVLDRCDGLLFAAPVMYYMVQLLIWWRELGTN